MVTCNAEIGKPGAYRGCKRVARYRIFTTVELCYCEHHKARTKPGNGHNGARPDTRVERLAV